MTRARDKLLGHVHGWHKHLEMALLPNDGDVALSKNVPNSRLECTSHTLFQTKMVKIDTLFQTKMAKKPFGTACTYIPHIREYPCPPPPPPHPGKKSCFNGTQTLTSVMSVHQCSTRKVELLGHLEAGGYMGP